MTRASGPALRAVPPAARLADLDVVRSDDVLDRGEPALQSLLATLPEDEAASLRERYDSLRGVEFDSLAEQAAAMRAAAGVVRHQHVATADDLGPLWDTWSGPEAETVQMRVSALARSAHALVTALEDAADALEAAGLTVAATVTGLVARVEATGDLGGPTGDRAAAVRAACEEASATCEAAWAGVGERLGPADRPGAVTRSGPRSP